MNGETSNFELVPALFCGTSVDFPRSELTCEEKAPLQILCDSILDNVLHHYNHNKSSKMSAVDAGAAVVDSLLTLRRAILSNTTPVPTTSADASASDAELNIAKATHLFFNFPNETSISFELSAPTRFISSDNAVDLRSIYLAWQNKDATVQDYLSATRTVNADLANKDEGGVGGEVKNLVFTEKLDLITWLEGAGDSEYIKPLAEDESLKASIREAAIARGDSDMVMKDADGGTALGGLKPGQKTIDPRLQEIYNSERKMGDRNSCLRGIKPTVRMSFLFPVTGSQGKNQSRPNVHPLTRSRTSLTSANPPNSSSAVARALAPAPPLPFPLPSTTR